MALTRKLLEAMGIESDKIDEIISAHRETVDALKSDRDKYREDAEKLPGVQKELDAANKKLSEVDDADNKDRWKVKYEALKEEHDKYKADVDAEKAKQKKTDAYRELLKETGVSEKRIAAVMRVSDIGALEFDKEGKLKDVDKLKEGIKKEWADFITQEQKKGAETQTPPPKDGDGGTHTPSRAAQVAAKHYEMMYGKTEENK